MSTLTAVAELCLAADARAVDAMPLRVAAEAAGTSTRMLVHDFGSRPELLAAARELAARWLEDMLTAAETRAPGGGGDPGDRARARWEQMRSPRALAILRLTAGRVTATDRTTSPGTTERGAGPAVEVDVGDLLVEATLRGLALARAEGTPAALVDRAAAQFLAGL